jgi:hypothetical protein
MGPNQSIEIRVKGMTAYFAVSVLIVTGLGVVFGHGLDLSHGAAV